MVTGRISFFAPGVLPDLVRGQRWSAVISSSRHCRADTVLVTKINVVAWARAIAAAPTMVLPAPQGSTTTPEPPCQNESAAWSW